MAQWKEWQLYNATTDHQRAVVELEYQRRLESGPDFTGYRTGSTFAEPPAHDITREDRNRILVRFDGVRSGLYKNCRKGRGQGVSLAYREVLAFLLAVAVKRRRVFPSLETIARATTISERTVSHALAWLRLYGFLDRIRRVVRKQGILGPYVRQTSNAYRLHVALKGLGAMAAKMFGLPSSQTPSLSSLSIDGRQLLRSGKAALDTPPDLLAALERMRTLRDASRRATGG